MPRDPDSAILQSALEQFYREFNCVAQADKQGLEPGEFDALSDDILRTDPLVHPAQAAGLEQFGTHDPRWVFAFLAAKKFSKSHGVHAFPEDRAPTVVIGNSARLVLFGDWASGIRRARDVADQIEFRALEGLKQKRDTHVISLGDVYYAGFDDEYVDRCLASWPISEKNGKKIKSWALNGNHDMYAGGFGYFRVLLGDSRFAAQNRSSYFLLENDAWRVAGLDTAYDPPDFRGEKGNLYGKQGEWVAEQFARKPAKKSMLLTHHQPFSAWESDSPLLVNALRPVFKLGKIDAWFWGHEHRCAVYRNAKYVKFASLLGHGGVPVKVGSRGKRTAAAPFTYEYRDTHESGYRYLGFAVADLDGSSCTMNFYNERGDLHHSEAA